jgi:tRNA threonylcarbamoyl adenosine modification protein YeaZ
MRILAIDVSISGCSAAVYDTESHNYCHNFIETDRGQAELLIPMIREITDQSGTTLQALDRIVVTRGPGSFTGVRIGLATARSLGLALDIPVYGVSTLDVLARSIAHSQHTLCLIDTKRGDFYGQIGEGTEPRIWSTDEVNAFTGPIRRDVLPEMKILAQMGAELAGHENHYDIVSAPTPLYLRDAEVSQAKTIPPQILNGLTDI